MSVIIGEKSEFRNSNWQSFSEQIQKFCEENFADHEIVLLFESPHEFVVDKSKLNVIFRSTNPTATQRGMLWVQGGLTAAIIDPNKFVIYSIGNYPDNSKIAEVSTIILQIVEFFSNPEKLESFKEEQKIKSRKNYINEVSKRFTRNLTETKKNIEKSEKDIQKLQQDLVRRIREHQGLESKLEQLESREGEELQKFGREFDMLMQVPKVKAIEVADGVIKVFTDLIYCLDDRTKLWHEIGEFKIEIYTSGSNNGVRWFNLTGKREGSGYGTHAPHVDESGKACMGNTSSTFPELIGAYEFAAVAMLAIEFVSSCNTDDSAGRNISNFPLAFGDGRKP